MAHAHSPQLRPGRRGACLRPRTAECACALLALPPSRAGFLRTALWRPGGLWGGTEPAGSRVVPQVTKRTIEMSGKSIVRRLPGCCCNASSALTRSLCVRKPLPRHKQGKQRPEAPGGARRGWEEPAYLGLGRESAFPWLLFLLITRSDATISSVNLFILPVSAVYGSVTLPKTQYNIPQGRAPQIKEKKKRCLSVSGWFIQRLKW